MRYRFLQLALASTLALAGCDAGADCANGGPSCVIQLPLPAAPYIPYVAGEFARTYAPPGTRYLNDHTVVRGADGRWHVFGITDDSEGQPFAENEFLHASSPSLMGPWTNHADALVADGALRECCLWAPHVVEFEPQRYLMLYYTEGNGDGGLRRADSPDADLMRWERAAWVNEPEHRPPGGRDPFLLRDGDRWLLYSVGVENRGGNSYGQILVASSQDLATWTPTQPVVTDPRPGYAWGNLESPTVVRYEGGYYLFVTRTEHLSRTAYVRTNVFYSTDPTDFGAWEPITDIRAHAAEVLRDRDSWFITSAGWTGEVGPVNRGLLIARLKWAPQ